MVIGALLTWRLWPNSFSTVMPADGNAVTQCSAIAMVSGLSDGQPFSETYWLDIPESQRQNVGEILHLLGTSSYRQDYRNLLPWGIEYVDADKNYDGHSVRVELVGGADQTQDIDILFLSSSIIVVTNAGVPGFRIYHPTNRNTMYDLLEYVKLHGTLQSEHE